MDDQSVFGYCEDCGIVYALKDRLKGSLGAGSLAGREVRASGESMGTMGVRASVAESPTPAQPPGAHWTCPDCGMEIQSDSDFDLAFSKREHIREYHPNRSTG